MVYILRLQLVWAKVSFLEMEFQFAVKWIPVPQWPPVELKMCWSPPSGGGAGHVGALWQVGEGPLGSPMLTSAFAVSGSLSWLVSFLSPEGVCWNEGRHLDFHISWAWAQISVWKIQLDPVSHAGLETFLPGLDEKLKWLVKNPVVYIEFTCNEGICLHMLSCKCRYMQLYNIEEKQFL